MFKAGDQVPVTLLMDVVGKAAKVAPEQIAATCVNVGSTLALTVRVPMIESTPQPPVVFTL
ncbi:hypothetical protein DBR32_15365 [Taibaiella sp. KBW10]|nr:hypothetical protein DBR32_15365 [Taibaiella sp. KBW10]